MARDLLQDAVDELYGSDPVDFLPHRKKLAAAARAAKDGEAATAIAALRKPTRSAHLLNQLARREPERVDELLRLAHDATAGSGRSQRDALRAMRELTSRRRRLIDDLADRAFAGAGDAAPTPGIRDEVVATLNAAVGDPDVGAEWAEGRLVRSHEWSGFGFNAADLASVPDERDEGAGEDDEAADAQNETADVGDDLDEEGLEDATWSGEDESEDEDAFDQESEDKEQEADNADSEDDPSDAAQAAVDRADRDLKAQQRAEQEQQDRIGALEDELMEAQIRLDEIRVAIRRAEMVYRRARTSVERLGGEKTRG